MTATFQHVRAFKAATGAGFSDSDAQRFGAYLEDKVGLGKRPVSPEEIVEAARAQTSPLHRQFTWDDREAAERWRVSEARHLVSHIVVTTPMANGEEIDVRAFHNVVAETTDTDLPGRGYVAERMVWQHREWSSQVVARARAELRKWTRRYEIYNELSDLVHGVESALGEDA